MTFLSAKSLIKIFIQKRRPRICPKRQAKIALFKAKLSKIRKIRMLIEAKCTKR
jgi:hypothetical protein